MFIYNFVFSQRQYDVSYITTNVPRQMLVPIVVADVKATVCIYVRLMLLPVGCGRCYYHHVIGTLLHRANTIGSEPHLLRQEEDHLYKASSTCKYPAWALNRIKNENQKPKHQKEQ